MRMADRAPTFACKLNQSPEEGKRKWRESEEKVKREVKSNSEESGALISHPLVSGLDSAAS
jgi:hypothetical protein